MIVAVAATTAPNDLQELLPAIERAERNCGARPAQVIADNGYATRSNANRFEWSEHTLARQPSKLVLGLNYQAETGRLWACYSGGAAMRNASGVWTEFATTKNEAMGSCWSLAPLRKGDR